MENNNQEKSSSGLKTGVVVLVILVVALVILAIAKLGGKDSETLGTSDVSGLQMEKSEDVGAMDSAKTEGKLPRAYARGILLVKQCCCLP